MTVHAATVPMPTRLAVDELVPRVAKRMDAVDTAAETISLDAGLCELVRTRASQINGCAFCLDMHTIDARAGGESEQRIHVLPAWREAPFYSDRERAALAWTEAVTLVGETHVPDDVYDEARRQFSEEELVKLTWAVVVINGWNRVAVAFRSEPGKYQGRRKA